MYSWRHLLTLFSEQHEDFVLLMFDPILECVPYVEQSKEELGMSIFIKVEIGIE